MDLVLLIETGNVAPDEVASAIRATFTCRRTHDIPTVLLDPPAHWANEFAVLAAEAQLKASKLGPALQTFWAEVPI